MASTGVSANNENDLAIAGSPSRMTNGVSPAGGPTASVAEEAEKAFRQRERLEQQMEALASFLTSEGMPGIRGSLVDEEGFPRADIDVHAICEARHKLACLRTDYREVQRRLEELLLRVHAETVESQTAYQEPDAARQLQANEVSTQQEDMPPPLLEVEGPAFALVDVVHPGSPSSTAGLACGDKVVRLGSLHLPSTPMSTVANRDHRDDDSRNGSSERRNSMNVSGLFQLLPGEVERHKDQRMPLVVQRGSRVLSLWLTPRQWAGRGLLGCHLKPIPQG